MRRITIKKRDSRKKIKIARPKDEFWHLHAHSNNSIKDALSPVDQMVQTVAKHGQKALALTDHGVMGGIVQLYKSARKAGIVPFPGIEAYVVQDRDIHKAKRKKGEPNPDPRRHLGLVAFTTQGYSNLVKIASYSMRRENYHHKPLLDFVDFAQMSEAGLTKGIAATTGCFFGFIQQALAKDDMREAEHHVRALQRWFPLVYVEMQHHGIYDSTHNDDDLVVKLMELADITDSPAVITQDAHYCGAEDKKTHDAMKRLVSFGPDPDDAVFPGDSFHLADSEFVKAHYTDDQWKRGIEGLNHLLEKNTVAIPALDNYSYNVPKTVNDPVKKIRDFCTPKYTDRFEEEMEVIEESGMAGYLWMAKELCDWFRREEVIYQTRGSASGSYVCYLLGITQMDPVKWKLRYERFLSKDRTKPPDIDFDIEDVRRDDVMEHLGTRFNVCQIGTYGTFSVDEEGRGSLLVSMLSKLRKQGHNVDAIRSMHDLPVEDQKDLWAISDFKVKKSAGVHAAGVVVTTTKEEFENWVPTMLIPSSNTTVTQFDGDDIEDMGYVKLDILGLRTLTLIKRASDLTGHHGVDPDEWVPLNDTKTFTTIRKGDTAGVFQLEGYATTLGCKEMKVSSTKDVIDLMALYRPAVMKSGVKDAYIRRMSGHENVAHLHSLFEKHFSDTYGLPIFQDQVISVLRDIGFTPEDLTNFLKAVKASNKDIGDAGDVIQGYHDMLFDLCSDFGMDKSAVEWLWTAIEGFSEYGFNRAHATRYGTRAVQCAYIKTHFPLEFYTALLETAKGEKERVYMHAAKQAGVRLMKPHVNVSSQTWTIDRKANGIRQGLTTIKGVGKKAADELIKHQPYRSVQEIIDKCEAKKVSGGKNWERDQTLGGTMAALQEAGALQALGTD